MLLYVKALFIPRILGEITISFMLLVYGFPIGAEDKSWVADEEDMFVTTWQVLRQVFVS